MGSVFFGIPNEAIIPKAAPKQQTPETSNMLTPVESFVNCFCRWHERKVKSQKTQKQ
jgi:hypothetical protein